MAEATEDEQRWSEAQSLLERVPTESAQRRLTAQVRGRRPVDTDRLPLARLVAEQLVVQRTGTAANLGLEVLFVGQWIADPSTARAVIAVSYGLLLAALWPFLYRDIRAARRFLTRHATQEA